MELNQVWGLSTLNSTSTFLQLETRSSLRGSGCIFPGPEQSEGICISSLCSSRPLPQTVTRPECVTPRSSCTGLAVSAIVPAASRVVCGISHSVPSKVGLLTQQGEFHPLLNLHLAGWLLSANHIQKQAFHNQLKPYVLQPGGREHPKPMHQLGHNAIAGVENGNLIQFKLL